jgi:succinate dehydrogenase / fumarate reductase flavoprotein subunit
LLSIQGTRTVDDFHKALGKIIWDYCGMARSKEGLAKARLMVQSLKAEFWKDVRVTGGMNEMNQDLEKACRVADFIELGELMIIDAYNRDESCGGHYRIEYNDEGEAKRDDENFSYVAAWEFTGENGEPALHKEDLKFDNIKMATRSYK